MYRELKIAILSKFDSQADFASAVKTHDTKVSMVLHGRRKLTKAEGQRWAKTLGCNFNLIKPLVKNEGKLDL